MLSKDSMMQLPWQQNGRIMERFAPHSVQLGRLIKGVQSEVVSWPQPSTTTQSKECRPHSVMRAVFWELYT